MLIKARAALASLRKRIADARRNSADHSSVELIVNDNNPFRFVQMLIRFLANRATTVIKPDQKRMAVRTLAMVMIAVHFNLLATSLALIRVGVHLFPGVDRFRLRLTRAEAGFTGYDGDGVFIDRELHLADSPLLVRAVLDQIASMRKRNPDLQGRFLFEQRECYRGHDLGAPLLTMAMSDLTKRYLGEQTGMRGFGFDGLREIMETAFDKMGEHEVAQQIRYPFRTPDPNAINTRALQFKQQQVVNELTKVVASVGMKDQVA